MCKTHFQIFFLFLLMSIRIAFKMKCPHFAQRKHRAHGFCIDKPESHYSCLFDINKETNVETCAQPPDFVVRGEKYIISGKRRSEICTFNRYQPFKFWSNIQSNCVYLKSLCTEDGQITYYSGTTIEDTTCRCDNTRGFRFVTQPHNPCYCRPDQEDCSCIQLNCPSGSLMSSDYICYSETKLHDEGPCALNTSRWNIIERNPIMNYTILEEIRRKRETNIPVVIVLFIAIIGTFFILTLIERRLSSRMTKDIFLQQLQANWSSVLEELSPFTSLILDEFEKRHLINKEANNRQKHNSEDKRSRFILLLITESSNTEIFQEILNKHCKEIKRILSSNKSRRRLPTRDEHFCQLKLQEVEKWQNELEPINLVDKFLENFVFTFDEYKTIIQYENSRLDMIDKFMHYMKEALWKGSFELLLAFATTEQLTTKGLQTNVLPAILLERVKASITKNIQRKITRVRVFVTIHNTDYTWILTSWNRIKYCSKLLIHELAVYPKIEEGKDFLELVPLADHLPQRIKKALGNCVINKIFEIILCGKEEQEKFLSAKSIVEVTMTEIPADDGNNDMEVKGTQSLLSKIISYNKEFLKKEVGQNILKDLQRKGYCLNINPSHFAEREELAEEIVRSIDTLDILDEFSKIVKTKSHCVFERLSMCKQIYSQELYLLKENIIKNAVRIIEYNLNVDDILEICIERKVFEDGIVQSLINYEGNEEQKIIEFIFRVLHNGTFAVYAFVDALHICGHSDLTTLLLENESHSNLKDTVHFYNNDNIMEAEENDILLEASFTVSLHD